MVFNDSWIGVPATTLTNWPDEYIHSSGDDLWQLDPTQLKRNAFIVASTALWLANAGASEAVQVAGHVAGRGLTRLGRDFATGLARIASSRPPREEDYRSAANLLAVSLEKEVASVRSATVLSPVAEEVLASRVAPLEQAARELQALLVASWRERSEGREPGDTPTAVEVRLSKRIPRRGVATLAEWLDLSEKVRDKRAAEDRAKREARDAAAAPAPEERTLTNLMQFAAMNWIDGKRNAAEIARRVQAEALSAGAWYYGDVTPDLVEKFFERQAKDGLIVW
jgi:hypothetical protein